MADRRNIGVLDHRASPQWLRDYRQALKDTRGSDTGRAADVAA